MKELLVVVDYQKDFVDGSLGFAEAAGLEEAICQKIRAYREAGQTVVFTMDTHEEDYLSTQEGRNLPVEHCIEGTGGWQLYGQVAGLAQEGDRLFCKPTFGSWELGEYLRQEGFEKIELCGVVSNICVLSNAVVAKAALPEAQIVVDRRCTASNDPQMNQKALDVLQGLQVQVIG